MSSLSMIQRTPMLIWFLFNLCFRSGNFLLIALFPDLLLLSFDSTYQTLSGGIYATCVHLCCFNYVTRIASDIIVAIKGFIFITNFVFSFCVTKHMSRLMGKPTVCIGENKDADQLRGNREADERLCFRYSDSTIPLRLISEIFSF